MTVLGRSLPIARRAQSGQHLQRDNRCLGFPLHRGSVGDGILTCHWHHARFDLAAAELDLG
jgi:nitrite reductase/ring-hydroxylating ferredoxin subunit